LYGNKFTNIKDPIPCTTLTASMRVDVSTNRTYIYGTDLGFSNAYFKTDPVRDWRVDIPNKSFYWLGSAPQVYNLTFPYANKTFLFSTKLAPNVSSVDVVDNTITLHGNSFTYNMTDVSVVVGSDVDCVVESVDFVKIVCSIPTYEWKNITDTPTIINWRLQYYCPYHNG